MCKMMTVNNKVTLYIYIYIYIYTHTHTHTRLTALCPGLPGWAGTRKVKPIWILLKQETVSGSRIRWAICKSALRSRQIATPAPYHSVFTGRMPFLSPNQQCQSTEGSKKHWRPSNPSMSRKCGLLSKHNKCTHFSTQKTCEISIVFALFTKHVRMECRSNRYYYYCY